MLTRPSLALSQFLVFCDLQSCEALALDERCSSEARNSRTLPGATTLARNSERLLNLAKKNTGNDLSQILTVKLVEKSQHQRIGIEVA